MIASLIIVLREVFEAALIIGIALAATRGLAGSRQSILFGIAAGVAGALMLAAVADRLTEALEGLGPELFNAGVLLAAVTMLGWHHVWMRRHGAELSRELNVVGSGLRAGARSLTALAMVVALAVLREGAEVVLFLSGIAAAGSGAGPMLAGSLLGLAGGAAIGALVYLGLVRIPPGQLFAVTGWLLLCLAAGMAAQAAGFLVQAGLVPALVEPLWDSSSWLPQHGPAGQVLHALAGYDDRPSAIQLVFFAVTVAVILGVSHRVNRVERRAPGVPVTAACVLALSLSLFASPRAEAAHKVYSPIVEEGETALAFLGHREFDGEPGVDGAQQHKLELEHAPTSFWLTEIFVEWEKEPGQGLEATEVAWENVFQIFEQGRYQVDLGLLVEYAHSLENGGDDKLEVGVLLQKEAGRNQFLLNLVTERDLASGADTELGYAMQYRWRGNQRFEPGVEIYGELGEFNDFGSLPDHGHEAGPAAFGKLRLGRGTIRYEAAWLFGLTGEAAAQTLRFLIEYEF